MTNPSSPLGPLLRPTRDQARLIDVLRQRDSRDGSRIADIYISAIRVLADSDNPGRSSQAAHAMRELLDKLTIKIDGVILRADLPDISSQLGRVKQAYANAQGMSRAFNRRSGLWDGSIDDPLRVVFRRIEDTIEHGKRFISRSDRSKFLLKSTPLGRDADEEEQRQFARRWTSFDRLFTGIAHHDIIRSQAELETEMQNCTEMLLERLAPPVSKVFSSLNALISAVETND